MKDPNYPEIKPIEPKATTINVKKTALLVLELSGYCDDPEYFASPVIPGITALLEKARAAGILIVFTLPRPWKELPHGHVYTGLKRKPSELLLFAPGFDKFMGGELLALLNLYDIDTLLMCGCKANMAVLYTATRGAQEYGYNIVIPVDGIAASTDYEKEYALFHLTAFPDKSVLKKFTYTTLDAISFKASE
jgi:nicotinamidase-related amidase